MPKVIETFIHPSKELGIKFVDKGWNVVEGPGVAIKVGNKYFCFEIDGDSVISMVYSIDEITGNLDSEIYREKFNTSS